MSRDALLAAIPRDSAIAYGMASRAAADSAHARIRPLREAADRIGDPALRARLMTLDVALDVQMGNVVGAVEKQLRAQRLAESARDTMTWMWSMRVEAMARNLGGQHDHAERLARTWMSLADRVGSEEYEAWGRTMLGWLLLYVRGDLKAARSELETSAAKFERLGHPIGLPYTLNLLGSALMGLGEHAAARETYRKVLEQAQRNGNAKLQGYALSNLATWEARFGDPSEALRLHRRSIALWRGMGDAQAQLIETSNILIVALALGRLDEARGLATEAIALAESTGLGSELPWQRSSLADVLDAQGQHEEAKRLWRSVVAMGDAAVDPRAVAAHGLARALMEQDSLEAARVVVRSALAMLGPGADAELRGKLALLEAALDDAAGRPQAAYDRARRLGMEMKAAQMLDHALAAWTQAAISARRLGRRDEAHAAVDSATALWEQGRLVVSDLEFREVRGEQARALAIERLWLETSEGAPGDPGARLARGFVELQRFRTRTLLERMGGAHVFSDSVAAGIAEPIADLGRFQRETLRDGELLLEFACGRDATALIAITRDASRLAWLPGEKALASSLALARGVFERTPGAGPAGRGPAGTQAGGATAAVDSVAARIGARLFADVSDLIATHSSIWIAPDGPLHRVPFAALRLPRENEPLLAGHRVSIVPSASVLAELRRRVAAATGRLLAFEGGASRGRPALPGARREVGDLSRRFFGVQVSRAGDSRRPVSHATLAGFDALHFAAHTRVDAQAPWSSGVVLGIGADGEDSLLTAESVAASQIGSPLVVLSSCESAGGRARSGEGVAGLGAAFLAAGSPAVVATLWPVEDRTTSRLMRRFYDGLARGRNPATALRDAQLSIRSDSKTSAPFYWAGFVLVGDGERGLTLRAKPFWMQLPFAAALVLIVILVATRGWRAKRRTP